MTTSTDTGADFWTMAGRARPEQIASFAQRSEGSGWDGLHLHDSQNLWTDPYVGMTIAALATDRLQLGISSTNAGTRHPAVTAGAIASIAAVAGDRVSVGLARGDSALAHIGSAPVSVDRFEQYVSVVRRYLHRESLSLEDLETWRPGRQIQSIPSRPPQSSQMRWLDESDPVVPIEVFATGPRVIGVGARLADRLTFGLGADPSRLRWGTEVARAAALSVGAELPTLGAFVHVAVTDDVAWGRSLLAETVAVFARFSAMHGTTVGPASEHERRVFESVATAYDTGHHAEHSEHVDAITADFLDTAAIIGPPETCIERFQALADLGIRRFVICLPAGSLSGEARARMERALLEEVRPNLHFGNLTSNGPTTHLTPNAQGRDAHA